MDLETIIKMTDRREAYMELAKLYLESDVETKNSIAQNWPYDVQWEFPDPRRLACQTGEKWSSQERAEAIAVRYGIMAKYIADLWELDFRDVLVVLGVEYNGMVLAQLKPEEIFWKVLPDFPPNIQEILYGFFSRKGEDKSLQAWNLTVIKNKHGEQELQKIRGY